MKGKELNSTVDKIEDQRKNLITGIISLSEALKNVGINADEVFKKKPTPNSVHYILEADDEKEDRDKS